MCQLQQKSLVNCFFASKPRVNTVEHGFGRVPTSCYLPAALGNGKKKKKEDHMYMTDKLTGLSFLGITVCFMIYVVGNMPSFTSKFPVQ